MLVLTRKPGQTICVGAEVEVKVIEVRQTESGGFRVRLGVEAPRHVEVDRQEVREAKCATRKPAAGFIAGS